MKSELEKVDESIASLRKNGATSSPLPPVAGALIGGAIGRHVGIAALGTAFSAAIPFTLIGLFIGLLFSGGRDE
jgi:hypothetical protein